MESPPPSTILLQEEEMKPPMEKPLETKVETETEIYWRKYQEEINAVEKAKILAQIKYLALIEREEAKAKALQKGLT